MPTDLYTIIKGTKDSLIVGDLSEKRYSVDFQYSFVAIAADHFEDVLFYEISDKKKISETNYK